MKMIIAIIGSEDADDLVDYFIMKTCFRQVFRG